MKTLLFSIIIITTLSCKAKLDKWITFHDKFNIGEITIPKQPVESVDTMITPKFKLVHNVNVISLDNKDNSPSTFEYDIIFPTNNNDFDLFKMKKDTNIVNSLFNNMINSAISKSNTQLMHVESFKYPEPGVKIIVHDNNNKLTGVTRIIIFDNFVVVTTATGNDSKYNYEIEETFFKSLNINTDKRTRK